MRVTVEVFGVVRELAGLTFEELDFSEGASARDALRRFVQRHPALVGPVFEIDGETPNLHYLINLDGRRFIANMDETLADGAHLLLIPAASGG